MAALFDAYVMVDWSAESVPKTGKDSIWVAVYERDDGALSERNLENPPTRAAAAALLADRLSDLGARGRRTLAGFDFSFGHPAGFAAAIEAKRGDWLGSWRALTAMIADGADNANNRFTVAARLNERITGGPGPFWGCPAKRACPTLAPTAPSDRSRFADRRLAEKRAPGTQSTWKLSYVGSVGSQSLLGIPRLHALRFHPWLAARTRVWPFETGLRAPAPLEAGSIVLAEIWPGIARDPGVGHAIRDARQVRSWAREYARLDETGELSGLFAGDPALTDEERRVVEREEGWILGARGPGDAPPARRPKRSVPLNDPQAIYRESFAIIRREADLSRFAGAMEAVALRVIHACGMPDIAADLAFSPGAAEAGRAALAAGATIFADASMVAHGIIGPHLPAGNEILCTLHDPRTAPLAASLGITRSAAAVDLWGDRLAGAVVAIGNAPTALFRLLDRIRGDAARPALVLGFAVGFVGAAEAKEALIASGLPFIALRGRRGGSAMAAAAVNALARGAG